MIRGLYTSAAGMVSSSSREQALAKNLENKDTPGYKGDSPTLQSFPKLLISRLHSNSFSPGGSAIGDLGTGVMVDTISTNFEQGSMEITDRPLDVAIQGPGFFMVQTPQGERATRNGAFEVDGTGKLVTSDGDLVLGVDGTITVENASGVTINRDGRVFEDGQPISRLLIVGFAQPDLLVKVSSTLFDPTNAGAIAVENPQVYGGYLEGSNVDLTQTMTEMISVLRAYEASQRMVTYQDQTLAQAVNEVGKVV